jgi:hypothetical protein
VVKANQDVRLLASAMSAAPFAGNIILAGQQAPHLAHVHRYAFVGRGILGVDLPDPILDLGGGSGTALEAVENLLFDVMSDI